MQRTVFYFFLNLTLFKNDILYAIFALKLSVFLLKSQCGKGTRRRRIALSVSCPCLFTSCPSFLKKAFGCLAVKEVSIISVSLSADIWKATDMPSLFYFWNHISTIYYHNVKTKKRWIWNDQCDLWVEVFQLLWKWWLLLYCTERTILWLW